jgi:hypothetical protein
MANDCSERICQFGLAHVDTPKGDLDASGLVELPGTTGAGTNIISVENSFMYPYGTTEKYPDTRDARSIGAKSTTTANYLLETAHFPMECSNKGLCDRSTGTCGCFPGYSGSACQYASCPTSSTGVCSGHGVCMDAKALALSDNGNPYRLWDQHATLGCKCDAGYSGPDCSQRVCKYGADPLYYDDQRNVRAPTFTYQLNSAPANTNHQAAVGNYSIVFFDRSGEDWQTGPIDSKGTCTDVINALEALPNKVVPPGSVLCFQHATEAGTEIAVVKDDSIPVPATAYDGLNFGSNFKAYTKFTISFTGNPGKLKQPQLNIYLDGSRPTLTTLEPTSTLGSFMYINGFGPEDQDFAPDLCAGVQVGLATTSSVDYLTGMTDAQVALLKKCLGDSNGVNSDNVDVYNWDFGTTAVNTADGTAGDSPHLIKLIDATQDLSATVYGDVSTSNTFDASKQAFSKTKLCRGTSPCNSVNPPGFYAVVVFKSNGGSNDAIFKVLTNPAAMYKATTKFNVYTSQSYLQKIKSYAGSTMKVYNFGGTDGVAAVAGTNTVEAQAAARADGYSNVVYTDSDVSCENDSNAAGCLQKGDYITIFATTLTKNPEYLNIYQIQKIEITPPKVNSGRRFKITLDYGVNKNYFAVADDASIYKVNTVNTYTYVSQCSGRGLCDSAMGTCDCFKGYTMDNCGTQSALVN